MTARQPPIVELRGKSTRLRGLTNVDAAPLADGPVMVSHHYRSLMLLRHAVSLAV